MKRFLILALLLTWEMQSAQCGLITGTASPFTGDPAKVTVTMDDTFAVAGEIVISLSVDTNTSIADLRGLFLHISDEALLGGLSVVPNPAITAQFGPANSVINLGGGNNLNGSGSFGAFDMGFEIGTAGIGSDDYRVGSFTLTHSTASLSTDLFLGQGFGVRVMSVGADRNGSSKLEGIFTDEPPVPSQAPGVVPEPATLAIWSIMGVCGLGAARRKRAKKA